MDTQTVKVDLAVFGHDVLHFAAARDDPCTWCEDRYDAAYCAALGRSRNNKLV